MSRSLRWSSLEAGTEVPAVRRTYQPLELFLFSAATWNPHRIHYDHLYATEVEGHNAMVVQGTLQADHVLDALLDALDVDVVVRSLSYRHRALLLVGHEAVIRGRVTALDDGHSSATFQMWMERVDDAEPTTSVTAVIERTRVVAEEPRTL